MKSSIAGATAADLNVAMEALFSTDLSGQITYEDESGDAKEEKTKYRLAFSQPGAGVVGAMTLKLIGNPIPASSAVAVAKPVARYDFEPSGTQGSVALISAPAESFERIWKQNVRDRSRAEVVDNVARLDVRVETAGSLTVSQAVQTQANNQLVIAYTWSDASGTAAASGTVTLSTSSVAGAGYSLGPIRITDNEPTSGTARRR